MAPPSITSSPLLPCSRWDSISPARLSGSGGASARSAETARRASSSPSRAVRRQSRMRSSAPSRSPRSASSSSAASSCTVSPPSAWASTSWISRAMRVRSSSAAARLLAASVWRVCSTRACAKPPASCTGGAQPKQRAADHDPGVSESALVPRLAQTTPASTATNASAHGCHSRDRGPVGNRLNDGHRRAARARGCRAAAMPAGRRRRRTRQAQPVEPRRAAATPTATRAPPRLRARRARSAAPSDRRGGASARTRHRPARAPRAGRGRVRRPTSSRPGGWRDGWRRP